MQVACGSSLQSIPAGHACILFGTSMAKNSTVLVATDHNDLMRSVSGKDRKGLKWSLEENRSKCVRCEY